MMSAFFSSRFFRVFRFVVLFSLILYVVVWLDITATTFLSWFFVNYTNITLSSYFQYLDGFFAFIIGVLVFIPLSLILLKDEK